MCCPFHGDKHPSMKVDSRFHCFACQADGDVIDFVGRLFQLSPYKAVEKLKDDFGMALADGKVRLAPRRPPTVRQQLLDYYRCLQRWRVRYSPQSPTEELHPCFLEAIKNLDIVEYYLDCSVLPDPPTLQTAVIVQQLLPDGGRSAGSKPHLAVGKCHAEVLL